MQGIKAFVGHSFSEADKEIVRIFTDHFDNLKKAHGGGFTWDHAEEAEALPLSDKVLAKSQDKNVFIGICTAKERAVDQSKLKKVWWSEELKAANADLVWKTSDWIIQEIGFAVGRGMSVIIFLEEGVRVPGGLYGNTEYISFSRKNPQQSFDKLLQMLVAISPKETTAPVEETKAVAGEAREESQAAETDDEPNVDWDDANYAGAAFRAIVDDNLDRLAKIDAAFKSSIHAQGNAEIIWQAKLEHWRILVGKKADFSKLKKLAEEHADIAEVLSFAAYGHEKFEEFAKAAEKYERAAHVASDDVSRARYLGDAAVQYLKAGNATKSAQLIADVKVIAANCVDARADLLSILKRIAEQEKDEEFSLALLEHEIENNPTDTQVRFDLAYKYSDNAGGDMALYHYLKIPVSQRSAVTWNNIGVSYGEFQLPVKGVRAFRLSSDAGETLAMSNLANKYLHAGFFDEAKVQCDKALAIPDYHKNVAHLLNRLKEVPEEENKKLQETLQKVRAKAEFFRIVGTKAVMPQPLKMRSRWMAPEGTLEAQLAGDHLKIFGSYERPADSFTGILSGNLGIPLIPTRHKIEFVGRLRGNVFFGVVSRIGDSNTLAASALLLGGGTKTLMYLNDAETEFVVMENYQSQNPTFYTLKAAA